MQRSRRTPEAFSEDSETRGLEPLGDILVRVLQNSWRAAHVTPGRVKKETPHTITGREDARRPQDVGAVDGGGRLHKGKG